MNEFQLIEFLTSNLKYNNKKVYYGVGDDAGVIKHSASEYLLYTVDSLVENIHFKFNWVISQKELFYYLGWKALAVNISDIYAMGGNPGQALVSLNIPARISEKSLGIFYQGLNACSQRYKVPIIGGNLTKSKKDFIITVVLTGTVRKKQLLLRKDARLHDYIYLQKGVGWSAAGLGLLNKKHKKLNPFILTHLKPEPDIQWTGLFSRYRIHACIDISDGLLADLKHVLDHSGKGAELYPQKIFADPVLKKHFPKQYKNFILYGGEDYKVLFTAREMIREKNLICIGRIIKDKELYFINKNNRVKINKIKGYSHF